MAVETAAGRVMVVRLALRRVVAQVVALVARRRVRNDELSQLRFSFSNSATLLFGIMTRTAGWFALRTDQTKR